MAGDSATIEHAAPEGRHLSFFRAIAKHVALARDRAWRAKVQAG